MAQRYEKIKLGLSAYITFALIVISIVVMIFLIVPSKHKRILNKYTGTYEVDKEGSTTGEKETKSYTIGEDHIIDTCSFRKLKKKINSDSYTYVVYGNTTSQDFKLDLVTINDLGIKKNEDTEDKSQKINKIYVMDSSDYDDDQKEYIRLMLREVNEDIKNVDKMPSFDIWVFKNGKMVNAYSRSEYKNLSLNMVVRYHIFNNK